MNLAGTCLCKQLVCPPCPFSFLFPNSGQTYVVFLPPTEGFRKASSLSVGSGWSERFYQDVRWGGQGGFQLDMSAPTLVPFPNSFSGFNAGYQRGMAEGRESFSLQQEARASSGCPLVSPLLGKEEPGTSGWQELCPQLDRHVFLALPQRDFVGFFPQSKDKRDSFRAGVSRPLPCVWHSRLSVHLSVLPSLHRPPLSPLLRILIFSSLISPFSSPAGYFLPQDTLYPVGLGI